MLASMSATDWSDVVMSELPTGTVSLLLADVEGSTQLWETRADEMTDAVARLDRTLSDLVSAHGGARPVEQGEGDSFVLAFSRATDAVACALELQRAPLAPIRLRIGVHTGEVQLRDEGNYIGPTINRTARLRDLGHGGQTLLSGATEEMVFDRLPDEAWLTDLGSHELSGVPRPERVVQLCHPDLRNDFPPLRVARSANTHGLPTQLTSFVGRERELSDVAKLVSEHRLVTLTGAGGAGKTRLAVEVSGRLVDVFDDGVWYVDLAPVTDPDLVPVAAARAFGLPDQPGRSASDTVMRFVGNRCMLMMLDNCEHLIDASAALVVDLLGACQRLTVLATSREPIAVAGEAIFGVPSLSLADEAIELFTDRARRMRPDFEITSDRTDAVTEICRRLDGMPLAIELAAARVRALSLDEIVDSLHDRFRLLTGGARTAVRRQQTLQASVDWSHALLTETERTLFRRLAVFVGGFGLDAAQSVVGGGDVERYQVLDQLSLLVDKSLVVAETASGRTRYRLIETVRQYALEKLGESGEADDVRTRHRDYYTSMAAVLDKPTLTGYQQLIEHAESEIDNLRAAFSWSRERGDLALALQLASSLQPVWLARGRMGEGMAWFDAILCGQRSQAAEVAPSVLAGALADRALIDSTVGAPANVDQAQHALEIARELDDPTLLSRALLACGSIAVDDADVARPYFAEAIGIARALNDSWMLSQTLAWQAYAACVAGDLIEARTGCAEGRRLAEAIGDWYSSRQCRLTLSLVSMLEGELASAIEEIRSVKDDAGAALDLSRWVVAMFTEAYMLTRHGEWNTARSMCETALAGGPDFGPIFEGLGYAQLALATLASGDVIAAARASESARQMLGVGIQLATNRFMLAEVNLAQGDLIAARRLVDEAISAAPRWYLALFLTIRARVAITLDEPDKAEHDAHGALSYATEYGIRLGLPDTIEVLADLAGRAESRPEAARLLGAAEAMRQRSGEVRFTVYQSVYDASVAALREALGERDFEAAWAEGAALSTEEAIAYAQRGRGERKRPSTGWASLTPAELDVVRLVGEGLPNKDVAARLFISPRTVQSHLTHVYTKLGLSSRVQLAQEFSARR